MSRDILLNLIDPDPSNARQSFDATDIAELAQSIQASGLAVPVMVRSVGDRFMLVHGERRYRAVKSLGWATIPADVRNIDAETASWLALVENLQRANLSPIEEAQAYQVKLVGMTQAELGVKIGKSQSHIATKLRYLKLPHQVQQAMQERTISEGHAKQLLRLDDLDDQARLCAMVIEEKMTVADLSIRIVEVIEVNKSIASVTKNLEALAHEFDILYQHVNPAQFRQFALQHGWSDTGIDLEILNILVDMYTDRYEATHQRLQALRPGVQRETEIARRLQVA